MKVDEGAYPCAEGGGAEGGGAEGRAGGPDPPEKITKI